MHKFRKWSTLIADRISDDDITRKDRKFRDFFFILMNLDCSLQCRSNISAEARSPGRTTDESHLASSSFVDQQHYDVHHRGRETPTPTGNFASPNRWRLRDTTRRRSRTHQGIDWHSSLRGGRHFWRRWWAGWDGRRRNPWDGSRRFACAVSQQCLSFVSGSSKTHSGIFGRVLVLTTLCSRIESERFESTLFLHDVIDFEFMIIVSKRSLILKGDNKGTMKICFFTTDTLIKILLNNYAFSLGRKKTHFVQRVSIRMLQISWTLIEITPSI